MHTSFAPFQATAVLLMSLAVSSKANGAEYKVQNLCSNPVYAAVGWAIPYSGKKAPWAAKGWIKIKPGQTTRLYRGENDEIYVHLSEKGRPFATPDHFLHKSSFCVTDGKFFSKERVHERTLKSEFSLGQNRNNMTPRTKTCQLAGGHWREGFYLVKANQTRVYTCDQSAREAVTENAPQKTKVVTETVVVRQAERTPKPQEQLVTRSIPYAENEL